MERMREDRKQGKNERGKEGGKEGRREGRKEGGKEGRKEGRKEGNMITKGQGTLFFHCEKDAPAPCQADFPLPLLEPVRKHFLKRTRL